MTIRLLCAYDRYPANAIVSLDAGTEAGLIAAKQAMADTTGGVLFVPVSGPLQTRTGAFSVRAGRAETILLGENLALTVTGSTGGAGTVQRLDNANTPIGLPIIVATGTLPAIASIAGGQKLQITCTAGSIDATIAAAVLGALQLSTDASGVPQGGSATGGFIGLRQIPGVIRVALIGDSISDPYSYVSAASTSIISPGISRATFGSAFSAGTFWPGDSIRTTNAKDRVSNTLDGTVTSVDPSRLWIEYSTPAGRDHGVIDTSGAGQAIVSRKYSISNISYLAQAFAQLGLQYSIVVDAALSSGDSAQVNEVLVRDWVPCDVAIYDPGMNDVYSDGRAWSFSQIQANDIANLKIARAATKLIILGIAPRNSASAQWSSAKFAVWRKVNEWRRQYAAQIGADFEDWTTAELNGKTYITPSSTTATPPSAGTTQTSQDGTHPYGLGGSIAGAMVSKPLSGIPRSDLLPSSNYVNAVDGYVITNPTMQRTTGGTTAGTATFQNLAGVATPEVADSFIVQANVGAASLVLKCGVVPRTKAVHGDSLGNAQRVIIDNTANGSACTVSVQSVSFHASMVDGDSIDFGASILLSDMATPGSGNPAGMTSLAVNFQDQHATAGNKAAAALAGDAGTGYLPGYSIAPVKRDVTRRVASAGAFSNSQVQVQVIVAAGQSACIDVGRVLGRRVV